MVGLGCVVEVTRIIIGQAGQRARPAVVLRSHRTRTNTRGCKRTTQKGAAVFFPTRQSDLKYPDGKPDESLSPVSLTSRLCVMFDMEL